MSNPLEALLYCDPNCSHEEWFRILAGAKAAGINEGEANDWSAGGDTYAPADFRAAWRSIRCGKIGEATLYWFAKQAGWKPTGTATLEELAQRQADRDRRSAEEAQRQKEEQAVRIRKAKRIWQSAAQAAHLETHGYALRKRIAEPFNARRGFVHGSRVGRDADCLLIPKQNIAGEFVGVEAINPQGERQSWGVNGIMPHGDLSGRVHAAEGWATGWALTQIFPGDGVVVTFGLSQLHRLGRDIAAKHGGSVVIHVDDDAHNGYDVWDWFNEGRGDEYRRKLEVCNG